jgi:hypothetical protein
MRFGCFGVSQAVLDVKDAASDAFRNAKTCDE